MLMSQKDERMTLADQWGGPAADPGTLPALRDGQVRALWEPWTHATILHSGLCGLPGTYPKINGRRCLLVENIDPSECPVCPPSRQSALRVRLESKLPSLYFSGMSVYATSDRKSPWLPCKIPRFRTELQKS
ncbi:hypothetical protein AAFF_G00237520 [Aldrovandia affinis]|uniref:Uncharacterized protein n=1 Tax=Aldrovandia affinis TaxID=143900 RepID=A0AAD7REP3_9TELE|nr:hypothetical protein AAFF_G00237520 [Aldrovandia affinis]